MFNLLASSGFQLEFTSHARAILQVDFPEVAVELEAALAGLRIPVLELIESGGGEARVTQRMGAAIAERGWLPKNIEITKVVDGVERESLTHEIDHFKVFESGAAAIEIEWNNKDPFFDRDLENFKRLHSEGVISFGCIITRGESFQSGIRQVVERFARTKLADGFDAFEGLNYRPTERFQSEVIRRIRAGQDFPAAWSLQFCNDKYGETTTHWKKLRDRIRRGVGNPCPLVLIGLPLGLIDEA